MEADVTEMQAKNEGIKQARKVHSSQFLTGMGSQGSLVDCRLVLMRMRGLVMGMWEDYGSSCVLCKLKPHFKVHLPIQQPRTALIEMHRS